MTDMSDHIQHSDRNFFYFRHPEEPGYSVNSTKFERSEFSAFKPDLITNPV